VKLNRSIIYLLVLLSVVLSASNAVHAQGLFETRINIGVICEMTSVMRMYDGGYLCGGSFGNQSDYYTMMPCIISYDPNGKIRWAKPVGGGQHGWITSLARSTDGAYFAAGYFQTGTSNTTFVFKFDSLGKTLWSKAIANTDHDQTSGFAASDDGGCFISEQISPNGDLYAMKFNQNGSLNWSRSISGVGAEAASAARLADGSFVVTGYTIGVPNAGIICKWLPSGDLAWFKRIGQEGDSTKIKDGITGLGMTSTHDGGFAICGMVSASFGNHTYIAKFDSSGSKLWSNGVDLFDNESARAISETSSGDIVVAGDIQFVDFNDSSTVDNVFMLNMKSDGSLKTVQILQVPGTHLSVYAMLLNPDGSLVISGNVVDSGVTAFAGGSMLGKFSDGVGCHVNNSLATMVPQGSISAVTETPIASLEPDTIALQLGDELEFTTSDLCALSLVTPEAQSERSMSIYPNPVTDRSKLTIEFSESLPSGIYDLSILDLLGKEVYREKINLSGQMQNILFDLSEYATGVYLIVLRSENKIIERLKFVKE
jgi:hypothetical protein